MAKNPIVTITMKNGGVIKCELYPEIAPESVNNFISGDASRHDRTHQGLGLAIAKKFLKEQGGMLCFYNHAESGAEVVCRIKTAELF